MKKKIIFYSLITLLVLIIVLVKIDLIRDFDNFFYKIITKKQADNLTLFFKIITNLANWKIIVTLCILFLVFIKDKGLGINLCFNSISSSIINKILKEIFVRPRPNVVRLIKQGGYSFPSGHSMASMSFYGFLIYLVYKSNFNNKIKLITMIILSIIILLIGISRIYLGVHYTSDVIAGYLVSIIYMIIYIKFINKA